jgi:tocopherol O-methyltransferase
MIWSHRDISLGLIASPSLWAFAFTQGRDFVAFLKAFQAMRKGFASGSFRYGVAAFLKSQ